ncbi:MAG: sulfatase-like hydrolase/transferase [Deltaproteobacteria bacterium]|nr:sulfatase-like hydrolase/transferase [Deltaproteobacteria bacterium]
MPAPRSPRRPLAALGFAGFGGLAACAPPPEAPLLVLISLDTLRGDHLGRRDPGGHSLSPGLDARVAQGLRFTQAFAQANESLFSHRALFLGQGAEAAGPLRYDAPPLPDDAPTLAAALAQAGWRTEAVVAGGHLGPSFGLDAGFQHYWSTADFGSFQATVPLALDRLNTLAAEDRPALLFVHGYDMHTPYAKPGPFFGLQRPGAGARIGALLDDPLLYERIWQNSYYPDFRPSQAVRPDGVPVLPVEVYAALQAHAEAPGARAEQLRAAELDAIRGQYEGALLYADAQLAPLWAALEAPPWAGRVTVVLFADHGEDLGEHGTFNHRHVLADSTLHVPLALWGPGLPIAEIDAPVGLDGLRGALLARYGVPDPAPEGRSAPLPLDGSAPAPAAVPSASMRGELSLRDAAGRLSAPRAALAGPPPALPPAGAIYEDSLGQTLPWPPPAARWAALQALAAAQPGGADGG